MGLFKTSEKEVLAYISKLSEDEFNALVQKRSEPQSEDTNAPDAEQNPTEEPAAEENKDAVEPDGAAPDKAASEESEPAKPEEAPAPEPATQQPVAPQNDPNAEAIKALGDRLGAFEGMMGQLMQFMTTINEQNKAAEQAYGVPKAQAGQQNARTANGYPATGQFAQWKRDNGL